MRYRVVSSIALAFAVMFVSCGRRGEYDYRIMVNYELPSHGPLSAGPRQPILPLSRKSRLPTLTSTWRKLRLSGTRLYTEKSQSVPRSSMK